MLDVKKPIAYLFIIVGTILIIYGLVDPQITILETIAQPAQQIRLNLDLTCGISMFCFACVMFALIEMDKRKHSHALSSSVISEARFEEGKEE